MVAGGLPVLTAVGRRVVVGLVVVGLLVAGGAVALVLRWEDVLAWLDAPAVLRVNAAALEVDLPPGAVEDPTRTACAGQGALRCAWTDAPPQQAVADVVAGLRALDVDVADAVCGGDALPSTAMPGSEIRCGARVTVRGAKMWVLATDTAPFGGVPLGRTALWFSWDTVDMSWPLYARVAAADPYPYAEEASPIPTEDEVAAVLPARYRAALDACWRLPEDDPAGPCHAWEGPVDVVDLPGDGQVEALVGELVAAGFFVDAAEPGWTGAPMSAHRFVRAGGWSGVVVSVRLEDGGLVAHVTAW